MAKTQTIEIDDELKNLYNASIERRDRFILGACQGHKRLPSNVRKKLIREQSLFGYLATFWRELTPTQKNVWKQAAAFSSLTNWQLFISDNAARIRHDLTLDIPPSDLWQVRAGRLLVEAPATEIILKQEHPLDYWVTQKITGQPWKQELVLVNETFSLPLELQIRYKSDLSVAPGYLIPTTQNTISGTVTLSDTGVEGATVRCIRQSDNVAIATETTDENGEYTFTGLSSGNVYNIFVEYEAESVKYNAVNFWNINGYIVDFELTSFTPPNGDAVDFALSSFSAQIPSVRYYARVWTSYQGIDTYNDLEIILSPSADWTLETAELTSLRGILIGYTLYLEIIGYTGEFLYDNIRAIHGGTNWARDPRCDAIDKIFTKAFAVVPPFWIPISLPTGSQFFSVYPPSLS